MHFLSLQIAKKLGASAVFLVEMPQKETIVNNVIKEMSRKISELFTRAQLADATIDCCGAASRCN